MGKSQAYRLIDAYQIVNNLSPIGDVLPANESQVRPLVPLTPFEQRKAWKNFLSSGMEMTALNIKKFITAHRTTDKDNPVDLTERISSKYMAAVQVMLEQVRVAQHDHWQQTSRQAALLWNRVIREKISSQEADNG